MKQLDYFIYNSRVDLRKKFIYEQKTEKDILIQP